MLYYFKKGKNASEMQKKRLVHCVEKVLCLTELVKTDSDRFYLPGLWFARFPAGDFSVLAEQCSVVR